jgi:hypothetical protein
MQMQQQLMFTVEAMYTPQQRGSSSVEGAATWSGYCSAECGASHSANTDSVAAASTATTFSATIS